MITKLELKLDEAFRKQYKLQTWGYYVKEKPSNTDVFFQIHSYIYDIDFKPLNLFNRKIDEFVISNRTPMPGQRVIIYISDELSDFDNLTDPPMIISDIDYPTGSIAAVEDAVNDANTAITSRQDISNSHLSDIKTYVDGLEGILNGINSKDFSTETTLAQVKSNLDDIKLYIDTLETTLNSLNSKDFATQATLLELKNIAQNILNELTEPTIIFDTTEQFSNINTTVDFTVTLTNPAVFDPNDYRKTASCIDTTLLNYTCAYYNETTKEITFTARPDGSTSTTITISYQKVV